MKAYMKMMKLIGACVVGLLVVIPSTAFAQTSITGIVKDTSGAVLPGVTVEASSPARYLYRDVHPAGLLHRLA